MRLLTIIIVFGLLKTADAKSLYEKEQNNETVHKTILIGNVTEISYGLGRLQPEDIWGETYNSFSNPRHSSWAVNQYFLLNNYLVQSGVEFNSTKADYALEYHWDSITYRQEWVNDTINTHYYVVDGEWIAEHVIDQYLVSKTDTLEKTISYKSTNQISSITIPINLGYRWRFEKFALYLKMGARFNYITTAKGKVFVTEGQKWQDFNESFEKKFYYSAATSIALEYLVCDFGSLILEPEYRYSWYSRVNQGYNNHSQFGIKVGIQIWF
jgi:hypothetical protein